MCNKNWSILWVTEITKGSSNVAPALATVELDTAELVFHGAPWQCRLAVLFALCEHGGVEIVIARDAAKVLARMQPAKAKDIREAIDKVAADPTAPNNNLRALKDVRNGFRIRVGASLRSNWRVSYTLDYQAGVVSVFEIAPRGGAYR